MVINGINVIDSIQYRIFNENKYFSLVLFKRVWQIIQHNMSLIPVIYIYIYTSCNVEFISDDEDMCLVTFAVYITSYVSVNLSVFLLLNVLQ